MSTLSTTALLTAIDETVAQLLDALAPLDEKAINTVPFPGSWTAAMVINHITKSASGSAKTLPQPLQPANRSIDAKVPKLKAIFLDFSTKMDAPEMVVPDNRTYKKQESVNELQQAFAQVKENVKEDSLGELVTGIPLGDITKLELLHFLLYHTQRHLHQLKNIAAALQKS